MADMFHALVDEFFMVFCSLKTPILSYALEEYNDHHKQFLTEAINKQIYDWYYGNFSTNIISLVFSPGLILGQPLRNEDMFKVCMSRAQVHDTLICSYKLIFDHGLLIDIEDYYGHTPVQTLQFIKTSYLSVMPDHLKEYMDSFIYIFKHGLKVKGVHRKIIRTWRNNARNKRLQRQTKAVRKIEDWWFEIVVCPDTAVGTRYLSNVLAPKFHSVTGV
jgi:hypothetical protein